MSRTSLLAAIAVAALMIQFFPGQANLIKAALVAVSVLYVAAWALRKFPKQLRAKRALAAQAAADEREFEQYQSELEAMRSRHGVGPRVDTSAIPQGYRDDLSALHDRHQAMLTRKFGSGRDVRAPRPES